ncbi:PREDICTED: transmembrane protein C1orf162 homolog isoform X2 [Bison bison bison]|uniref:Transmembrane protein C1orf162 homolog isoform X2 n=1 Tax=Bison bison bison TaxID=43346 RepID=A0A6P3GHZ6_BISBB|nr:PREDICTED: transmembrane protein C1orf162 homolog isoform X2 [Bison bison bison]XP_014336906.1 PREDICTED: transmembrane protein C1orf162 homolog isoform X2 [Bos mutus]
MGTQMSKPEPNDKGPGTHPSTASAVTSAPCLSGHPSKEHLVLAFFAGVILTLLLMAFVFLIIKSCRKCPMGETCSSSSWHLQQVIPVPRPWILLQIIQPSFHPQRRYLPMPA